MRRSRLELCAPIFGCGGGKSGCRSDVTSTYGAWKHAGGRSPTMRKQIHCVTATVIRSQGA